MTTENSTALKIKDLSYTYVQEWTRQKKPALKNLNLDVFEGESFGFLGHNGAGKTTTIKCILDLIRAQTGEIFVFGQDHRKPDARKNIGYVPEQPYFYDYLTVLETIEMYACLAGISKDIRSTKITNALDLVRLSGRKKSPVRSLSKGLMQRLAMAQAIIAEPKMLILDEPFSGLDPIGRKDFRDLLACLKEKNTTIFMSSHILSDVEFLCDRVSIMAHGEVKGIFNLKSCPELDSGSFELVIRHVPDLDDSLKSLGEQCVVENKFIRIIFSNRERAELALKKAIEMNISIESFEFVHGSLEDLFVKLVKFEEQHGV